MYLDPNQQEAVDCPDRFVGVIAPAGSGKTRVFIERICKLIDSQACQLDEILCITYTRIAAREIQKRLRDKNLKFGTLRYMNTIHSCFFQEIQRRKHWLLLGYDRCPEIAEEWKIKEIYWELKELNLIGIESFKNFKKSISEYKKDGANRKYKEVVKQYNQRLKDQGLMDFDDVLIGMKKLISLDSEIGQNLRNKWKYILIDECQDSPQVLFDIFREIVDRGEQNTHFFMVGDLNQGIFGFSGACDDAFEEMKDISGGQLTEITLTRNYRSGKKIIEHCNNYRFYDRFPKSEAVEGLAEGKIFEDGAITPKAVITDYKNNQEKSLAILYWKNSYAESLIPIILDWQIPFKVGERTFQHIFGNPNAGNILNSLRCILFLCAHTFRWIFQKNNQMWKIFELYFRNNIRKIAFGELICVPKELKSFERWGLIESFIHLKKEKKDLDRYMDVIREGMKKYFNKDLSSKREYAKTFQMVEVWIKSIYERNKRNSSLPTIIAQIEKYIVAKELSKSTIILNTIHGSKGLEWDRVMIWKHEIIKDYCGCHGDDGKLYYVASSRAKEELFLR